jgi:hypothetical protein
MKHYTLAIGLLNIIIGVAILLESPNHPLLGLVNLGMGLLLTCIWWRKP